MSHFEVGDFSVHVSEGGYPVFVGIALDGKEIRFSHRQLPDIEYVIKRAKQLAMLRLPEKDRIEVTA